MCNDRIFTATADGGVKMQVGSDYRGGQESGGFLIRGVEGLVGWLGVDVYFDRRFSGRFNRSRVAIGILEQRRVI